MHRVAVVGAVGDVIGLRCHLILPFRLDLGGGGVVLGGVETLRTSWKGSMVSVFLLRSDLVGLVHGAGVIGHWGLGLG